MPFPAQAQFIRTAEEALSVRFPASYVAKMRAENGGTIVAAPPGVSIDQTQDWTWELIPISDTSSTRRLSRTCNDIVRETADARTRAGFPSDAVVIAEAGTGDLLLFCKRRFGPDLDEAVYWWDHETTRIEQVADDFSALRLL